MFGGHDLLDFDLRGQVLRQMNIHLIAIEVSIECGAVGLVHAQHCLAVALHPYPEAHHGRFVQRGLPVEDNHVPVHHVSVDGLGVISEVVREVIGQTEQVVAGLLVHQAPFVP